MYINLKKFSGVKADSIEENEKIVDKSDIEEFDVYKLKPRFHLNALKYLLEIKMFEADGTVEVVEKWVKCLEEKALETPKDNKAKKGKSSC